MIKIVFISLYFISVIATLLILAYIKNVIVHKKFESNRGRKTFWILTSVIIMLLCYIGLLLLKLFY